MTAVLPTSRVFFGATALSAMYEGDHKVWEPDSTSTPPFTPTDIGGLVVWLDAAQITGLADGAAMTAWGNSVPGGANATTVVGNNPVYRTNGINGHPAVRFGELGPASMRIDHAHTIGNRTVFQVLKTAGAPFGTWHTTQVQELDPYLQTYGNPTIHTYSSSTDIDSGVAWSGAAQLITLWADASAGAHWLEVDGIQKTGAWSLVSSPSPFFIGGFQPGGYFSNSFMGEILIYERAITPTERADVHNYLHQKWGI